MDVVTSSDFTEALKDDQRLLLRFASAEAVAARKSAPDAQGFRVELDARMQIAISAEAVAAVRTAP